MTKTLYLLRHAEAESAPPMGNDHSRPLSAAGRDAARRLQNFLAAHDHQPQQALVSDALRTLETARLAQIGNTTEESRLYLATAEDMMAMIQSADDALSSLMLVAHNPGIAELAQSLDTGEILSFRPGTLAIFHSTAPSWGLVSEENTRLEKIFAP